MAMQTDLSSIVDSTRPVGAHVVGAAYQSGTGPGPSIIDAREHTGDSVVNLAGDDLGTIEAIMLDVESGQIAYAVLSFGGFLGMGTKCFALPWAVLTLDSARKRFILDASREKLEKADGFDKDHWPTMADPDWALRLHRYYNVPPYWDGDHQGALACRAMNAAHRTDA
jgi:hypothetical protein